MGKPASNDQCAGARKAEMGTNDAARGARDVSAPKLERIVIRLAPSLIAASADGRSALGVAKPERRRTDEWASVLQRGT